MNFEYQLSTPREDFYNITPQVSEAVTKSGIADGIAVIYCPHTTAGYGGMREKNDFYRGDQS